MRFGQILTIQHPIPVKKSVSANSLWLFDNINLISFFIVGEFIAE